MGQLVTTCLNTLLELNYMITLDIKKIPGTFAKYFICDKPGYAYPLFKIHKLDADRLRDISIFDIPTSLLQSAGNITTSKITALLEYIFQPINVKFCSSKHDEYCRDSKHYLLNLVNWKNNAELDLNENNLYIVVGNVKSLYPSIPRSLVKKL